MKLVRDEAESGALSKLLEETLASPVASALVRVELRRAVAFGRGNDSSAERARAEAIIRAIDLIALDDALLDDAGRLQAPGLRSLDAIHVASARLVSDDLTALVTYDRRMAAAARDHGVPILSPGSRSG